MQRQRRYCPGACQRVSILTRPEGRVQPSLSVFGRLPPLFQSSPDPKAGCNRRALIRCYRAYLVSILTRPEGRVQRFLIDNRLQRLSVSILTRPEGRVQLRARVDGFRYHCFNPHPTRRPGATFVSGKATPSLPDVSILTRPEGRVQHDCPHAVPLRH